MKTILTMVHFSAEDFYMHSIETTENNETMKKINFHLHHVQSLLHHYLLLVVLVVLLHYRCYHHHRRRVCRKLELVHFSYSNEL